MKARTLMKDIRVYGLDAAGREGTIYRIVYAVMMTALATTAVMGFTAWFVHELAPWLAPPACVAAATSVALRLRARRLRDVVTFPSAYENS